MNNDQIREQILEALYSQNQHARSRDSELTGIRELAQLVKVELPKIKETQVASNTSFLVRNDFVEEVQVENYFSKQKFGGSKPSYKYRLSRDGLAYFEHDSKFDRANMFAGIGDITGSGNMVIIGNSNSVTNLVNSRFSEGHNRAEELRRKINALGELPDDSKFALQADIETIKSQLSKEQPDTTIISKAKDNLGVLANIATVAPYAIQLFDWLHKALGVSK